MAKTLIGNIKGKNGRGITSIKKTGTTGSVDTYTITYTDSTTSTFTINNSDGISLQRQIVPSAAVESSATASQAYAAGDYVVVNGVLRKVESAIAKGNTISDSNSTATTVTGELATLGDSVSYTKNARVDAVEFTRIGKVVMFYFATSKNCGAWTDTVLGKVPPDMFPAQYVCAPIVTQQSNKCVAMLVIDGTGSVIIRVKGDNAMAGWGFCGGSYLTAR